MQPQPQANQWRYWKAHRHKFGPGKTHLVHLVEKQKTICGVLLSNCPGQWVPAVEYDCQQCAKVVEARQNREQQEREWKERQAKWQAERQAERAAKNDEWWADYRAYLQTPQWAARRRAVLERENWICEACRKNRATQVHHETYKHLRSEPLFELHAICDECHEKLTEQDREAK